MRYRGANASWPLAELVIDSEGVLIRGRGLMSSLLPRWFRVGPVPWPDVQAVRLSRGSFGTPAVELSFAIGRTERQVRFWCLPGQQGKVVAALEAFGCKVDDDGIARREC